MILTEQKVAIVYGKSYDQKGTFRPVVVTSTDLNRYLSPYDKLIGTCICKKEFLVIQYMVNGLKTVTFDSLENGEEESPILYNFLILRINKMAKVSIIDDSWENMHEDEGIYQKHFIKLYPILDQNQEYKGFVLKFYTFENEKACINFWGLDEYGKFVGTKGKFEIQEKVNFDQKGQFLGNIVEGKGYDFIQIAAEQSFFKGSSK